MGITQQEFAAMLNPPHDQSVISKLCQGNRRGARFKTMKAISDATGGIIGGHIDDYKPTVPDAGERLWLERLARERLNPPIRNHG